MYLNTYLYLLDIGIEESVPFLAFFCWVSWSYGRGYTGVLKVGPEELLDGVGGFCQNV